MDDRDSEMEKVMKQVTQPETTTTTAVVHRSQQGMTLIEIMVVIVIIGILGSALAVGVFGMLGDAKEDTARAQVNTIGAVIEAYEARKGEYPDSLEALTEGKRAKLKKANLKDPWKQDINFSADGEGFTLCSNGDDKRQGTDDDICYGEEGE